MQRIFLCLVAAALFFASCGAKRTIPSAEVWNVSQNKDILVLGAKGYGNKDADAVTDAEQRAFRTLLFRGVPNTAYKLPLAPDGESAKQSFFNEFFSSGEYRNFITSSKVTAPLQKNKDKNLKELALEVGINTFSLRKHLENEKVINKFGF